MTERPRLRWEPWPAEEGAQFALTPIVAGAYVAASAYIARRNAGGAYDLHFGGQVVGENYASVAECEGAAERHEDTRLAQERKDETR